MKLKLYNTRTRSVDEFRGIEPGKAGMYTCGPTVYDYAHIGNLRTYVFEDLLKRALREAGLDVTHVMNITDVGHLTSDADTGEDKVEAGARREGKTAREIAEFYTGAFKRDIELLGILAPDTWCTATEHIAEMIELVQRIEKNGYSYAVDDGVYFDTSKFKRYGDFARLDMEGLQAGARVEVVEGKKNHTDFALWKLSPSGSKRQMEWPSPWGVGFPGWHIECSAMSIKYLGEQFDIHCGGVDHIQVHHTNEIAQAEAATGKHPWVNWWLHGEFLVMGSGKMAKSEGGFVTLQSLIDKGYDPMSYRYLLLGAHYRQQLAFSFEALDAAQNALSKLRNIVRDLGEECGTLPAEGTPADLSEDAGNLRARFLAELADDLNCPRALAVAWDTARATDVSPQEKLALLLDFDRLLGLGLIREPEGSEGAGSEEIEALVRERDAARAAKDYAAADAIRSKLVARGILLRDTPQGTRWERKR